MDILMVSLRLVHIIGGVYWVGTAMFLAFFAEPAILKSGEKGDAFLRQLYTGTKFGASMGASSLLTTLAGLVLYYKVSGHFNADWMQSANGVVLSIGAVAGLLAAGHGMAALGPKSGQYETLVTSGTASDQEINHLRDYLFKHGRISLGLMLVAVVGMASARYM
jgi:uncharacterized membrane protein